MKSWIKKSIVTLGALALVAPNALLAQAQDKEFDGEEVTVAVVGESSERTWNYVAEKALEEEGITINMNY